MSIHSGLNRFVVWDFNNRKIELNGLVSHGCCYNQWGSDKTKNNPIFSNEHKSHCSSLGKFKVGSRGYSNWGININYMV